MTLVNQWLYLAMVVTLPSLPTFADEASLSESSHGKAAEPFLRFFSFEATQQSHTSASGRASRELLPMNLLMALFVVALHLDTASSTRPLVLS